MLRRAAVALALLPAVAAEHINVDRGAVAAEHINVDTEAADEKKVLETAVNMSSIRQLVCNNKRTLHEGDATPSPPLWKMQKVDQGLNPQCDKPVFVGTTHLFEIEQRACGGYAGVARRLAPAVERLVDAGSFYDYGSYSAHTGFEAVGRSIIYLYRDLFNPNKLSLFTVHGKDKNKPCQILCSQELYHGDCGHCGDDLAQCMSRKAVEKHQPPKYPWAQPFEDKPWQDLSTVWMSIAGVPDGTHIVLSDDGTKEFGWTNDLDFESPLPTHWDNEWDSDKGEYIRCGAPSMSCPHGPPKDARHLAGRWQFYHNTDGGAIDGLPLDEEWELKLDIKFGTPAGWRELRNVINWTDKTNMNDWRYYLGDGQFEQLSECAPFYIRNKRVDNVTDPEDPDIINHTCTPVLAGDVVTFCAVAITKHGGPLRFDFDWGDGATTNDLIGSAGALVCADHVYAPVYHDYEIQVVATNEQGCNDTRLYHACVTTAPPTTHPTSAPTAPTDSPTVSPTVEKNITVRGDPFITFGGKSTQFYLPVGEETLLLHCGSGAAGWALRGAALGTGVPGDTQQWFRSFAVRAQGSLLRVEAVQGAGRPAAAAAAPNATGGEDVPLELAQRETLRQIRGAAPRAGAAATLRARLDAGGKGDAAPFNYTVTQDPSKPLGAGFVEVVTVTAPDFGLQFTSSSVQKGGAQNIHLDLLITKLNVDGCGGILPELWGVAPLSEAVSKMLIPPGA